MLPQAQKDIRRALRGLGQELLNEVVANAETSLGCSKSKPSCELPYACDLFVKAVERCGISKLFGSQTESDAASIYDFVTDLSIEEMRDCYALMNLDKGETCACDDNDRGVMKRLIMDEMYMTGFESLLSTFPSTVLRSWCKSFSSDTQTDDKQQIKNIMSHVFNLDFNCTKSKTKDTPILPQQKIMKIE